MKNNKKSTFVILACCLLISIISVTVMANQETFDIDISDLADAIWDDDPDINAELQIAEIYNRLSKITGEEYTNNTLDVIYDIEKITEQEWEVIDKFEYEWVGMEKANIQVELPDGQKIFSDFEAIYSSSAKSDTPLVKRVGTEDRNEIAIVNVSPDYRYVYYITTDYQGKSNLEQPYMRAGFINTKDMSVIELPVDIASSGIKWSPDGNYAVINSFDIYAGYDLIELATGEKLGQQFYGSHEFSPDSAHIAILHDGGKDYYFALSLMDVKTGSSKQIQEIEMHTHAPIANGPFWIDENTIVFNSAYMDLETKGAEVAITVKALNIKNGDTEQLFKGTNIYPVAVSPLGTYLLCVDGKSSDDHIVVYNTLSKKTAQMSIAYHDLYGRELRWESETAFEALLTEQELMENEKAQATSFEMESLSFS